MEPAIAEQSPSTGLGLDEPLLGNYFVAAYPPFSVWTPAQVPNVTATLNRAPDAVPLGVYVHLPFCQKKCDYCYYLSYIAQPAAVVNRYLDTLLAEAQLYVTRPAVRDRPIAYAYFGGGTPSILGSTQIRRLFAGLREAFRWNATEEITFECAPRSVSPELLTTLREVGVTRLSLGVQSLNDRLLALNGRVHLANDVRRAYRWIAQTGFDQVNLDLMCGLIGETDEQWRETLEQVAELAPDGVTLYQTEIPRNTRLCHDFQAGRLTAMPVSWESKRARLGEGFQVLERAGYTVISAYNAVRDPVRDRFRYQEYLWRGADLIGLGVASFGYLGGAHYQNHTVLEGYEAGIERGELPIQRAFDLSARDRLVREFILQLKLGTVLLEPLRMRYGVDPLECFSAPLRRFAAAGWLNCRKHAVELTRSGLLRVDRLLPYFYDPTFHSVRYN